MHTFISSCWAGVSKLYIMLLAYARAESLLFIGSIDILYWGCAPNPLVSLREASIVDSNYRGPGRELFICYPPGALRGIQPYGLVLVVSHTWARVACVMPAAGWPSFGVQ